MRHLNQGKKFGRERSERKAFMTGLVSNLIQRERVTTTETRAKEMRRVIERFITYGKKKDVAGLRLLMKRLPKKSAYKLFHEIAPRYEARKGGYTRVRKLVAWRKQDGSRKAIIEFV